MFRLLVALVSGVLVLSGCDEQHNDGAAAVLVRGAERMDLGPKLPSNAEPTCVAQTLHESGISDEVLDIMRGLGSDPSGVGPFVLSDADEQAITSALEAAAGYCQNLTGE